MVDKNINVEKIDIHSIVPADYNPRQISDTDYKNLKNSIDEFGIVSPIIINLSDNTIISGHQRFDILYYENNISELYLLKLGDIGWVFTETDLKIKDKNYEKTLNIALNRIHGEFDPEKVNEILVELEELKLDHLTGFDLELDDIDYSFISRIEDEPYEEEVIEEEIYDDIDDEIYEENVEEEINYEENEHKKTSEKEKLEKTSEKKDEKSDRIRRGFIKYGDIYKIGDSYLMFGKETNEQDRTKLFNVSNKKEIARIPSDVKKIKTIKQEISYYMSEDAELIENTIIKNKSISKKVA